MRRHWMLVLALAVTPVWRAMPALAADEAKTEEAKTTDTKSVEEQRREAERRALQEAEAKRKEALDAKIRLLEALDGSATVAPKAEQPERVIKSVSIKPSARATKSIEWNKTFENMGEIKDSNKVKEYGKGNTRAYTLEPEPTLIDFTVEADMWKLSWSTETDLRAGKLKMDIKRKITLGNGLTKWVPATNLPSIRAGAAGERVMQGKGDYQLELLGLNVKYKFIVEEAKVIIVEPEPAPEEAKKDDAKKDEAKKEEEVKKDADQKKIEELKKLADLNKDAKADKK